MPEIKRGLPDGNLIVRELDRAYASGSASEVLVAGDVSGNCHGEVLRKCFSDFTSTGDPVLDIEMFLSRFERVRKGLLATFEPIDETRAVHFRNMTPLSAAMWAKRIADDLRNRYGSGFEKFMQPEGQFVLIERLTEEASRVWEGRPM